MMKEVKPDPGLGEEIAETRTTVRRAKRSACCCVWSWIVKPLVAVVFLLGGVGITILVFVVWIWVRVRLSLRSERRQSVY